MVADGTRSSSIQLCSHQTKGDNIKSGDDEQQKNKIITLVLAMNFDWEKLYQHKLFNNLEVNEDIQQTERKIQMRVNNWEF